MNDEQLEQLLKASGARPQPSVSAAEDIRRATESAWLEAVAEHKRRARWGAWRWASAAMIALVCGGIAFTTLTDRPLVSQQVLAHAVYARGDYWLNGRVGALNTPIAAGDTIGTGDNGTTTLQLSNATTLTLAPGSELKFNGYAQLQLLTGKLYVDSPGENTSIEITTPWGKIEDIGTQFEVSVDKSELRVAMREGKVKMSLANSTHLAQFNNGLGDVISVDSSLQINRTTLASDDEHWNWMLPALTPIDLEGLSVHQLMLWASRTMGKPVIYDSPDTEERAKRIHLSGGELAPDQIADVLPFILKTTTLVAHIGDDNIEIGSFSQN